MKGAGKILSGITIITVLLLFYVHEQVSLFAVSYRIQKNSALLTERGEEYRRLKFEVDQLKAPRLLEEKMRMLNLDLTLPKQVLVVRIPSTPPAESNAPVISDISLQPFSEGLLDFLGRWVKVAQAKTDS
jgi:hypothetical protein